MECGNGFVKLLLATVGMAEEEMGREVVGLAFKDQLGFLLCLIKLSAQEKEFAQCELGIQIGRIEFHALGDGVKRLLQICRPTPPLQQGQTEFVMGLGILGVQLEGIFEFKNGFGVFAISKVGIAPLDKRHFLG